MTTEPAPRIKITYATLRADNEDLHAQFEAGLTGRADLPRRLPPQLHRGCLARRRRDVRGPFADRHGHPAGDLRVRHARRRGRCRAGRPGRPARVGRTGLDGAARDPQAGRRPHQRPADGVLGAHGDRGRQEPDRGARRGRGGRRPDPLLRPDGRGQRLLRPPDGQPRRRRPSTPAPSCGRTACSRSSARSTSRRPSPPARPAPR